MPVSDRQVGNSVTALSLTEELFPITVIISYGVLYASI